MYTRSVGQVMSSPVETVDPETLLRAAATTMIERDLGAVASSLDLAAEVARTR